MNDSTREGLRGILGLSSHHVHRPATEHLSDPPTASSRAEIDSTLVVVTGGGDQGYIDWLRKGCNPPVMSPIAQVISISPDLAHEMLRYNTHNRNIKPHAVNRYTSDMKNGTWNFDGAPIRVGTDGTLLDGQNRLTAIINSGVTCQILVWYGINRNAQKTMDVGPTRTMGDTLSLEGVTHGSSVAAAARVILAMERDQSKWLSDATKNFTTDEILDAVNRYPDLVPLVARFRSGVRARPQNPRIVLAFQAMLMAKHPTEGAEFIEVFTTGIGAGAGDPAYVVREKLLSSVKYSPEATMAMLIKAYNAWAQGRTVKALRWGKAESFPVLL